MHGDEGAIGLARAQRDQRARQLAFEVRWHQAGTGMRRRQRVGIFFALDEGQIRGPGEIDRRDIRNQMRKARAVATFGSRQ